MKRAAKFIILSAYKTMETRLRQVIMLFVVVSTFFLCSPALAVPFTWTDTIDPNPDRLIRWGDSFSYYVNLPGILSDGVYNFSMTNNEFGWSLAGLFSLNTSGTYKVTITSILGDFFFNSSTLTAKGDRNSNTASVPEPAAMVLFGAGLVLFGIIGRKFKHS